MVKKALTTSVIAIAAALIFSFTAWSGSTGSATDNKPVQAQMSGCGKCNKGGMTKAVETKKNCNKPGCDKQMNNKDCSKDPKDCPQDCPKKI